MPYYAVAKGSKTGVYNNWSDCKAQVNGYSGASFKKFNTAAEANAFVSSGGNSSSRSSGGYSGGGSSSGGYSRGGSSSGYSGGYSGRSYSGGSYSGGYSSSSISKPSSSKVTKSSRVYVDGASRGNGKSSNAPSGYGVYWGPNDPRNAAVPLDKVDRGTSYKPTNQRAELSAINHALKDIHNDLKLGNATTKTEIHSDSRYAIRSVDEWSKKWAENGWKNSKGESVANQELIKETILIKSIKLVIGVILNLCT